MKGVRKGGTGKRRWEEQGEMGGGRRAGRCKGKWQAGVRGGGEEKWKGKEKIDGFKRGWKGKVRWEVVVELCEGYVEVGGMRGVGRIRERFERKGGVELCQILSGLFL